MTYRSEVQTRLRSLAMAGPFYEVTYDPSTKVPSVGSTHIAPSSAVTDEISSNWAPARRNRRDFALDREGWTFLLKLEFQRGVSAEAFEEAVASSPPVIVRDAASGRPKQLTLILLDAKYEHPLQQQPNRGSQIDYTFEARLSPA
jgi:hypothetical protein